MSGWMSPELQVAWEESGAGRYKDLDTFLRLALNGAADDRDAKAGLLGLRDELWQHEFGRPAPSQGRRAFGPWSARWAN